MSTETKIPGSEQETPAAASCCGSGSTGPMDACRQLMERFMGGAADAKPEQKQASACDTGA